MVYILTGRPVEVGVSISLYINTDTYRSINIPDQQPKLDKCTQTYRRASPGFFNLLFFFSFLLSVYLHPSVQV